MTEPSQSREQLRRAIQTISSRPPPDSLLSEDNIPTIQDPGWKEILQLALFVTVIIFTFLSLIITAIAWQVGYFK